MKKNLSCVGRLYFTAIVILLAANAGCQENTDNIPVSRPAGTALERAMNALEDRDRNSFTQAVSELNDIDSRTESGKTLLNWALLDRQVWAVQILVSRGADVNLPDDFGDLPLAYAIDAENLDLMRYLVKAGADPNGGKADKLPIIAAVQGNRVAALGELIRMGAKTSVVDSGGVTLLQLAAQAEYWEILTLLLETRPAPDLLNKGDSEGRTPLHEAALVGKTDIVRQLLDAGAQRSVKDRDGWTPLAYVEQKIRKEPNNQGLRACAELLKRAPS